MESALIYLSYARTAFCAICIGIFALQIRELFIACLLKAIHHILKALAARRRGLPLVVAGSAIKRRTARRRLTRSGSLRLFDGQADLAVLDAEACAFNGEVTRHRIGTGVEATDANIRAYLAKIKGQGRKVVYANAYTIWNIFAGINDGAGNKAFIPSPQADPVTQGVLYGMTVKLDDNLADKVMYAGIPGKILANNFEDLFINRAMDPKTFEDIIAGYSLFDAGLENPLSFVKVTFQ